MSLCCAGFRPLVSLHTKAPSSSTLYKSEPPTGATIFQNKKSPIEVMKKVVVHHNLESRRAKFQDNEHAIHSVPVQVAEELLRAGYRYLDIRSVEEYNEEHIEGFINIPHYVKWGGQLRRNYNFLDEVEARFGKDERIIVGCKSGKLSTMVAMKLVAANFTMITTLGGGYVAWEKSGLPTVTNGNLGRRTFCDHRDDTNKEHVGGKERSRIYVRNSGILYD